jgi:hypothetical protein
MCLLAEHCEEEKSTVKTKSGKEREFEICNILQTIGKNELTKNYN